MAWQISAQAEILVCPLGLNFLAITCTWRISARAKCIKLGKRKMINEVIMVCKLIQVNPATSAAGERSFSTAQRLKTWLRSTMTQE